MGGEEGFYYIKKNFRFEILLCGFQNQSGTHEGRFVASLQLLFPIVINSFSALRGNFNDLVSYSEQDNKPFGSNVWKAIQCILNIHVHFGQLVSQ